MNLKYFCLALATAVALPGLTACSDFEMDKVAVVDMGLSGNAVVFEAAPAADHVETITVTTDASWKVTVNQGGGNWLAVSPTEGTGNGTITLRAERNQGPARSAILTVSAPNAELMNVTVKQKAQMTGTRYNLDSFDGLNLYGPATFITLVNDEGCDDGKGIRIYTRPGEEHSGTNGDRFKVGTETHFYSGRYEWRVYTPKLGMNDRTSIAGFIYYDDTHELDFEICSGRSSQRAECNAAEDELVCLITSQANPYVSKAIAVKAEAWHNIAIDMKLGADGKYVAEWLVDDIPVISSPMTFGEEIAFQPIFSVENLSGMGDHAATQENYAIFDWFEYIPYDYSKKPTGGVPGGDVEPEGKVTRWDFDDNQAPADWIDASTATFADGWMTTPMPRCNVVINKDMGEGRVTFEIDVPSAGAGEKYLAGPNIFVNNQPETVERSFSMFVWPGTQEQRDAAGALPGQMLVRCYTESLGVYNEPIDPGKHTFSVDLRLNEDGAYNCSWIIDGQKVKSYQTWYTAAENTFSLQFCVMSNGGGWQGESECTRDYETRYSYIEYKRYGESGDEPAPQPGHTYEFDSAPEGWNLGDAGIADGCLNISNAQVVSTDIAAGAAKYTFELDVPAVPAGEKWFNGLNIYATNAEERSFSLYLCPGAQSWRDAAGALPGQMLVRCYTETMDAVFYPVDPGKHTFEIDLQLTADGFLPIWSVDGWEITRKQTWYTPEQFTFATEFRSFANGGGWQGETDCTDTYTGRYGWFDYKPY